MILTLFTEHVCGCYVLMNTDNVGMVVQLIGSPTCVGSPLQTSESIEPGWWASFNVVPDGESRFEMNRFVF